MSTERKWSARAYKDGDEAGIFELWTVVYPKPSYNRDEWMKWWNWLYKANPNGRGVSYVADHGGRIVGHASEIPVSIKIGNEVRLAGLGADALTHPDYRRQGMYVELVKARRSEGERRGMLATYSFPNELSYPAMQSRGLTADIGSLEKVVRPISWRATVGTKTRNPLVLAMAPVAGFFLSTAVYRAQKAPQIAGATVDVIARFDERFDALWSRVSPRYQVAVVRRQDYLNWRYTGVPDKNYTVLAASRADGVSGYLVYSSEVVDGARAATIVDVFAESDGAARRLIWEAVQRCRQEKMDLVYSARVTGSALAASFKENGFLPVPRTNRIRLTGLCREPAISEIFMNPANWFLQIGDSDHG